MANLGAYQFKTDLAAFAKLINVNTQTVVQMAAAVLWKDIIEETPVKTGRARSGWALVVDEAGQFVPAPGENIPAPPDPDFAKVTTSNVTFIVNHLEYIEALEDGHSKQAPVGMVRRALIRLEASIGARVAYINSQSK